MKTLVIDIGATNTRFAIAEKKITSFHICPTRATWPDMKKHLVQEVAALGQKFSRVVVGVPGTVRPDGSATCANLPRWRRVVFAKELQQLFHVPVLVKNDAELNALGEAVSGAGKGKSAIGFLTVSTGVNGALILDGRPDVGAFPFELQLLPTGNGLTLGQMVSGRAIKLRTGTPAIDLHDRGEWKKITAALAEAIVTLCLAWRPDIFVVGGPMMNAKAIRLSELRTLAQQMWRHPSPMPKIVVGTLGQTSGLWGGLKIADLQKKP